ncbi:MAG: trypsin-like peptidase domain-containing protein, partial [Methylocella sp.]
MNTRLLGLLRAALLLGLVLLAASARSEPSRQTPQTPQTQTDLLLSFAPVVKKAQPAVVNVYASRTDRRPRNPLFDDPIFRHFFGEGGNSGPGGRTARSLGSGVLVDALGLVVTNYHVIEGMTDVKVALADKREFDAGIVLRDRRTDLVVLRLKGGENFPVMELGDSDALEVGDIVLAIGNPFGVGQTVTQGIVSALARTQVGISDYGFFIQTDAAVNPGNSGGALVDMRARLVGINSAIFSQTGSSIGIGFAIPINMVKIVIAAAKGGGHSVRRPWLGASLQMVSREIADSLGLDRPMGALVADLSANGPAAEAGLRRGDLVTAIDGQSVDDPEGLGYRLATKPLGGTASLALLRKGKPVAASIKLMPAPEIPARDPIKLTGPSPFSGVTVINLSPAVLD